jgi:hypothetical protein
LEEGEHSVWIVAGLFVSRRTAENAGKRLRSESGFSRQALAPYAPIAIEVFDHERRAVPPIVARAGEPR